MDGVHAGFEATGEIRRNDFGIHFGPLDQALGNVVKLELDLEFLEPERSARRSGPARGRARSH